MNNFEKPNSAAATFNLYSAQEALKKAEQEEAERRLQPIVNEMRAQSESLARQVELLKKEDAPVLSAIRLQAIHHTKLECYQAIVK